MHIGTGAAIRVEERNQDRQLQQLSEEVGRIASTLSRLTLDPVFKHSSAEKGVPDVSPEFVASIIRARRLRSEFFPDLFADPAWDILLDLLHAEIRGLRVSISSLCVAAGVPATTALRWLNKMVDDQLLVRRDDPHDKRRTFIELSPEASLRLRRFFSQIDGPGAI